MSPNVQLRQPLDVEPRRKRMEIIRFATREDCSRAIDVLIACGLFEGSSHEPNVWNVRTDVVRALLAENVPFEWLTRSLP